MRGTGRPPGCLYIGCGKKEGCVEVGCNCFPTVKLPAPARCPSPSPSNRGGAKGNDERDQTLNQLLSEMDGFDNKSQVGGWG